MPLPGHPSNNIRIAGTARRGPRLRSHRGALSPVQDLPRRRHNLRTEHYNIQRNINAMDNETAGAIKSLTKQLHALSVKLEPFKGNETENVEDFIKDFNKYVINTGQTAEEDMKQVLQTHLKDLAKEWWKLQDDTQNTAVLLDLLKDRFKLTEHAQHARKIKIYGMKQKDDETYLEFVSSVQTKSRSLGLDESDQVAICLSGAKPHIRVHLAMQTPKTFKELLNLPVARDEGLGASPTTPLVNIVQEIRELKDSMQNSTKKVQFVTDTPIQDNTSTNRDISQRSRSVSPHTPKLRDTYQSRDTRDKSPAPEFGRQDSGERSYARALTEPMSTYGEPRRCTRCGSTSYCYRAPTVCPAYERYCYNCGRRGHFRALCLIPPIIRPPQSFRGQNIGTGNGWTPRDRAPQSPQFRRNFQNYNGYRNYNDFQNYNGYQNFNNNRGRSRTPNRYGGGNGQNFSRNRTPNFRGQDFNRNVDNRYRNQNRSYYNSNRSQSC